MGGSAELYTPLFGYAGVPLSPQEQSPHHLIFLRQLIQFQHQILILRPQQLDVFLTVLVVQL